MSDFEPFDRESPHPEQLLDELESIKGVLDANDVFAIHNMRRDMAVPDGTLSAAGNGSARLLNIEQIFEQEIPEPDAAPDLALPRLDLDTLLAELPANVSTATCTRRHDDRAVLIQALVDELLPRLESALRRHLEAFDDAALRRWGQHR